MRTVAALCRELLPDRRSDGELVAAFTSERNEAPFLELVRRHGPLVWSVCRRLLPHPADAEDAFQATFLVLASQSAKLVGRSVIGPWLYRVAVLTARNVRRKNARRLARQRELPEDVLTSAPDSDLKADIDAALLALPERYRQPIVLCHLQGFTRREAAERLGCAEGTLSAWLNRGLAKLRIRLRDLDPLKALSVPAVAVPAALSGNTVQAAIASGVAAATIPPAVSSLVEGVLHMLWIKKATATAFALCAVFVVGVGVGLGTRPGSIGVAAQDNAPAQGQRTAERAEGAPDADDKTAQEIAEQLRQAEEQFALSQQILKLASEQFALKQQQKPGAKPAAEELDELRELEAQAKAREAELQALKALLAKRKNDKLSKKVIADDNKTTLLGLDELKEQLRRIETERAQLLRLADESKQKLAATEEKLRLLEKIAADLAMKGERTKAAAPAGSLEITVAGKGNATTFVLRETPPQNEKQRGLVRAIGPVTTSDPAALAVLLARAKGDPNGPREVRILAEGEAPANQLRVVLEACKTAGFKSVTAETIPQATPNRDKKPASPAEAEKGAIEQYRRALDELRKHDVELSELRKREKALQDQRNSGDKQLTETEKRALEELLRIYEALRKGEKELQDQQNKKPASPAEVEKDLQESRRRIFEAQLKAEEELRKLRDKKPALPVRP